MTELDRGVGQHNLMFLKTQRTITEKGKFYCMQIIPSKNGKELHEKIKLPIKVKNFAMSFKTNYMKAFGWLSWLSV